jgi:hypothetical protein
MEELETAFQDTSSVTHVESTALVTATKQVLSKERRGRVQIDSGVFRICHETDEEQSLFQNQTLAFLDCGLQIHIVRGGVPAAGVFCFVPTGIDWKSLSCRN